MKKQTGIWIDSQKAMIISIADSSHTAKTIESNIETKVRIPGESKSYTRFGDQFFDDQQKKENRQKNEVRDFLKEVLNELGDTDELVIFGPAEMKKELEKFVVSDKGLKLNLRDVVSADSMTENQTVAWVKDYFSAK